MFVPRKAIDVFIITFVVVSFCFLYGGVLYARSVGACDAVSTINNASKEINPHRIMVKFKSSATTSKLDYTLSNVGVKLKKKFKYSNVSILNVVDKKKSIKTVLNELKASGIVEYAEPDYLLKANIIPNDPQFGDLWGLHNLGQDAGTPDADIDSPEAWNTTTESTDMVVAVIDTGVDYNHEDLAANIWINPGEIPANGIDDDGNGYVDDIHGIDPCNGDSDPFDDNGHGTHCSGTIAAVGDNDIGIVGINWGARIMALKFLDSSGSGYTSDAVECLEYGLMMKSAYNINLTLSSNSWGGGGDSQALYDVINAWKNMDMLFVAAAGNDGTDNDVSPQYPSNYELENIITVAATNRNDNMAYFSCYGGESVDIGAPGEGILSTTPGNTYAVYSGTSMATPHVAGAAVLLWTMHPSYGYTDIKEILLSTVDPLATLGDKVVSGGRLNIDSAINCTSSSPWLISSFTEDFSFDQGTEQVFTARLVACRLLRNVEITAVFNNGDAMLTFQDDGVAPDQAADDGIFTAVWVPENMGTVAVTINAFYEGSSYSELINGQVNDFSGYHYDDTESFEWINISGTGMPLGLSDDSYTYLSIPFKISFYGVTYDHIAVGSNGQVYFENKSDFTSYRNLTIPSASGYGLNRFIAALWDDLNPESGGEIYCEILGDTPERKLVVQFEGVPYYPDTGAVSFEIILFENSDNILIQYLDVDSGGSFSNWGASATVGVQKDSEYGQQYSYNRPALHNEMAIRWYREEPAELQIDIQNNKDQFYVGETLETTVSIFNATGNPVRGDIWIAIQLPGGAFLFYPTFSNALQPTLSCANIPVGAFVSDHHLLSYLLPEESEGVYRWYGVIVACGSDVRNTNNWLASDIESFTVVTQEN